MNAETTTEAVRYLARYLIVDGEGDVVFMGQAEITSPRLNLDDEMVALVAEAGTAKNLRASADRLGYPAGRVLVTLLRPV
jgi:hypothetical protein